MIFNADLIEAFSGTFLSPLYDEAKPTPEFHRTVWGLYASDAPQVACAAPRNHAKSTALTHDYLLCAMLFRVFDYAMILGSSEEMAIEHLQDIANELRENEDILREFAISKFIVDQKTDIIVMCKDGHQFRIIARGAEQKIRGRKWKGQRLGLIVADDCEDDEQVDSKERREKFRKWFLRAAKQALRDGGKIRIHGTILHEDSLLSRLIKDQSWTGRLFKAHEGFDDFSNILWPEKFNEARLRQIRKEFIDAGDSSGYSQEYLNDPFDNDEAYFRGEDFLPMTDDDRESSKIYCAAADFAVSKATKADRSCLGVGGKDTRNLVHLVDVRVDRWDSLELIEEMFSIQKAWNPGLFFVESGAIWRALAPMVFKEMQTRDCWINIVEVPSTQDKPTRGRSLQRRMRARGMRFDQTTDWYPGYEAELRKFTGYAKATRDDQFDMTALLSLGFDSMHDVDTEDFYTEEEADFERQVKLRGDDGRSVVTGY